MTHLLSPAPNTNNQPKHIVGSTTAHILSTATPNPMCIGNNTKNMYVKQPTKNSAGVEAFLGASGFEASSLNVTPPDLIGGTNEFIILTPNHC